MSTFQTLISLVLLIFGLSVGVQAIQELIKWALDTKVKVMAQTIENFMGNHLTLAQVQEVLHVRGLNLTALEKLNKNDFRHLLNGVPFQNAQLQGVIAEAGASIDQVRENIAASYEALRAQFQQEYTRRNKLIVALLSFFVVIVLNANVVILYEQISSDQAAQQTIVGKAMAVTADQPGASEGAQAPTEDLGATYSHSRDQIDKVLQNYPVLIRTSKYSDDFKNHPYSEIPGLLLMGVLVSLGAPFWNDILKGMMGINNSLNANSSKAS
ncbi:MAG: hypothetical protein ABSF71_12770 [Terriglobia bacterium]|jgi:hypothetical protein